MTVADSDLSSPSLHLPLLNSTWIVIILIIVACAVAVGEISARFIVGANRTAEDGFRVLRTAAPAAKKLPSPPSSSPLSLPPASYFAIGGGDSL